MISRTISTITIVPTRPTVTFHRVILQFPRSLLPSSNRNFPTLQFLLCQKMRDIDKHLAHIGWIFGRGLEIVHMFAFHKWLDLLIRYRTVGTIRFVPYKDQHSRIIRITFHLINPIISNRHKRVSTGQIKNQINRMRIYMIIKYSTFVVGVNNSPESLLARCVPDLHFNYFVVHVDWFKPEIHTDCC